MEGNKFSIPDRNKGGASLRLCRGNKKRKNVKIKNLKLCSSGTNSTYSFINLNYIKSLKRNIKERWTIR